MVPRAFLVLFLSALCASWALAAPKSDPRPAPAPSPVPRLAPADEYFGRMKISPIGIGNEIHDLGLLLKYDPGSYGRLLGRARMTEDALLDWRAHYPTDTWLAKDVYLMARVYAMFYDSASRVRAWSLMTWVAEKFAETPFGYNAKGELRHGHVVPLYAMPDAPPTPPPVITQAPSATPAPTEEPSAAPDPTPTP